MRRGAINDALTLAKQRWAQQWPFDLADESWEQLFATHRSTDVLEAIKHTKSTRSKEPSAVHASFCYWVARVERERREKANPTWPPSDVQTN